jgi:probable F420-dependent oxidoreductase
VKIGVAVEGIRLAAEAGSLAERIEQLGFDSIWTPDHLAFTQPILDPFTVLGIYAARTKHIVLGTGVFLLPLRHPALVAKQAASLDWLCGGRFVLGIGVGGEFPREFEAAGVPLHERGARTNEAIPILRALWAGEAPPAGGRFFDVPPTAIEPAPTRKSDLPIWVGGRSEAALRRAAHLADGYIGYLVDADGFRKRLSRIREIRGEVTDAERRNAPFAAALVAFARIAESRAAAVERTAARLTAMYGAATAPAAARFAIAGTADDCRERAAALAAAGVEHLVLSPIATLEEYDEQLAELAGALISDPSSGVD